MSLWKVEFHCHTNASRDSLTTPARLVEVARRRGLQKLVVTDHNSVSGALAAKEIDPELIIVGEEILTQKGELLTAFVKEEVPPMLPPMEAIERLKAQNAFISVSHPFDLGRSGWQVDDLLQILPYVDAIEVFNARCVNKQINELAAKFAQIHQLAVTVGSDAHAWFEIGRATLSLPPFQDADELRTVIRSGTAATVLSSPFVHLTSVYYRW